MFALLKNIRIDDYHQAFGGAMPIVVYGCGVYGRRVVRHLLDNDMPVVALSDRNPDKWGMAIANLTILSPEDAGRRYGRDAIFFIAIADFNQKPLEDVKKHVVEPLTGYGCRYIAYSPCLYEIFARHDAMAHGGDIEQDVLEMDCFSIPNFLKDEDPAIRTSFGQALSEQLYKPLPKDEPSFYFAPYDNEKEMRLNAGDIVLDCGANLGTFAAHAATKGCNVYCFEPDPDTAARLEKTASLYPGRIGVVRLALSDFAGEAQFYRSSVTAVANHLCDGSETPGQITVPVGTVDMFVSKEKLPRVDFIKADIEGAERNMLMGAADAIRKYKPKLSISSYHLPDDRSCLERLIKDIEPGYSLRHYKDVIYAW